MVFIQESQVVADRLAAAVEEVNRSISQLTTIADSSIQGEEELQIRSNHAALQLQEAFAAIQQVAAAADQILDSAVHMHRESEQTKETVIDVCKSLNTTDEVMSDLHNNNDKIQQRIEELHIHTSKIEEINAFIREVSNRGDGTFIFSLPEAGLVNGKSREWWKKAMSGEFYISPEYVSAITKKPCITLSKAIMDKNGTPIGVIGMDLLLK